MRRWLALVVVAAMVVSSACEAVGPPALGPAESAWCDDHDLPDADGGVSVASVARELKVASPEMEKALAAMDAAILAGAAIVERQVKAMAAGDTVEADRLAAEYRAWQLDAMGPLKTSDLATALVAWRQTPGYVDACRTAFGRRGAAGSSAAPTLAPVGSAKPTQEPTEEPTEQPTEAPTPGAQLVADDTLNYTSATSVGRLIELTVTVRNKGTKAAGKITMEIEGVDFVLERKTPLGGCTPNCKEATGAEGVAFVEWTGPAAGKSGKYTAQLKAKATGTYEFEVRLHVGRVGDYSDQLGSWTVTSRVR